MTDEVKSEEQKQEPSPYLTKVEFEQLMSAHQQQITGMLGRLAETLTPKEPKPQANVETKSANFYEKPEEAANALFEAKMAPMREMYVANEKAKQLNDIAALPFAKDYLDEIKKVIESAPPLAQASPGFAQEAYNLVVGRHREEVFKKMREIEAKPKPEFTETVTAGAPAARKSETLSSQERDAAHGMGVSEEEYKKWRDNPDAMAAAAMTPSQKKAS